MEFVKATIASTKSRKKLSQYFWEHFGNTDFWSFWGHFAHFWKKNHFLENWALSDFRFHNHLPLCKK